MISTINGIHEAKPSDELMPVAKLLKTLETRVTSGGSTGWAYEILSYFCSSDH
jgi:hypothetical protein